MTAAEFSRPIRIDTIGIIPHAIEIAADAGERAALARRFDLLSLDMLRAEASVTRTGDEVRCTGRIAAMLVQACVASGDPVPATIAEPFTLRFVPEGEATTGEEEVELAEGDLDTISYGGGAIDLGEAAAQTLALALDPFPRAPGAEAALRAAGVVDEAASGPFGALAGLRDLL